MKETFPELGERAELIEKTLRSEEESFNKTLDRGIELFAREADALKEGASSRANSLSSFTTPMAFRST